MTCLIAFGRSSYHRSLQGFRVAVEDGEVVAFQCLPRGWKDSAISCQRVLESLVRDFIACGLMVLVFLDDVLVIGCGCAQVTLRQGLVMDALQRDYIILYILARSPL